MEIQNITDSTTIDFPASLEAGDLKAHLRFRLDLLNILQYMLTDGFTTDRFSDDMVNFIPQVFESVMVSFKPQDENEEINYMNHPGFERVKAEVDRLISALDTLRWAGAEGSGAASEVERAKEWYGELSVVTDAVFENCRERINRELDRVIGRGRGEKVNSSSN